MRKFIIISNVTYQCESVAISFLLSKRPEKVSNGTYIEVISPFYEIILLTFLVPHLV